jgi:ABC-type antimicrobial peptide transport system permease subunit
VSWADTDGRKFDAGVYPKAATVAELASLLFGVSPLDPLTHSIALVTLSLVVLLASLIPALRATRLHPLLALRQD